MKINCMAFEQLKSVKQLFLETILKSFMVLFTKGKVSISYMDLLKSTDSVYK